jgi:M6 family metalloprotease-like protein
MKKERLYPLLKWTVVLAGLIFCFGAGQVRASQVGDDPVLGPHSKQASGELRVLMAAVKFPDVEPRFPLERTRKRAVEGLNQYVREQSYGLAWIKADFRGWVPLPDPLAQYQVSPYNFKVDRGRVRKLVEDSMSALENQVDFSRYQHLLIIPGVFTMPGQGYGMICYCANPGMLSGVRKNVEWVTLKSKGGRQFSGGVFMGTENAHLGMFAHDFFHALGGIYSKKRLVPCLYDYERQSDASKPLSPENHAIYLGSWDIMSEHFVQKDEPPPGLCSFTKIRLGWIEPNQVMIVKAGETACAFLSPLAQKGDRLVVKIPISGEKYYLVENRQPIGYDRVLPDSGLLVLKVNPWEEEGSGTVRIMDADKKARHFSRATFRLDQPQRQLFLDEDHNLAIIPLWQEDGKLGVLITSGEKKGEALKAALKARELLEKAGRTREDQDRRLAEECAGAVKTLDFKKCL